MIKEFQPDDIVKSCPYIEAGVWFNIRGMACCCLSTYTSPELVTSDEINSDNLTYELLVQRRKELFEAVNGLRDLDTKSCKKCLQLIEKKYKDVNFEYLGGVHKGSSFNIQHFTSCNLRCTYCAYTISNNFVKPQYDILKIMELYREKGKLLGNNWIDFNGGEPSLLENFDEILSYLIDNNLGTIVLYSNAVKYSDGILNALKNDNVMLVTSIDSGTVSSYKNIHGGNAFHKVFNNLIKYKSSGTKNIQLKYIVTDKNMNDDDIYGFLLFVLNIQPGSVMISIDFNVVNVNMSIEYAKTMAKIWYLLEKYGNITPILFSDNSGGDPIFVQLSKDIRQEFKKLKEQDDYVVNETNIININNTLYANEYFAGKENADLIDCQRKFYNIKQDFDTYKSKMEENINRLVWWIPIRKWRDNFRNQMLNKDQTRPDQTRPDQTRPDQTRPD
ncbi:hypothetical protein BFL38_10955 [Brachyspira hampsonii]|uniref:Radical SAM core domain-containing protein n=1 Tax=Brachyspira hampsonii TaxID=1287055 RepID=A0A1E5NII1_9SPIR|nr:radical SAM protein [Brachyspira hampsonii]OEJ15968.1 hypothetical protein BFL38_10955 [Brachyspira hampsonii]